MMGEFTVPFKDNVIITLRRPDYLPVIKNNDKYFGGSQMWFSANHRYGKDYILHNYGCGTIATADLFLYLAMQNSSFRTPVTDSAIIRQNGINYMDYIPYVYTIHHSYIKTKPLVTVLGPSIARAVRSYSRTYGLGLKAAWKWKLNYYDMYDRMEEMLGRDLPVILSIGPNVPKLWGRKGIPFYELKEIDYLDPGAKGQEPMTEASKPYYYKTVEEGINGHYVTVTALIKDEVTGRIMLRISSWGKQYYINYEEYRDYIDSHSTPSTSSLVYITDKYF